MSLPWENGVCFVLGLKSEGLSCMPTRATDMVFAQGRGYQSLGLQALGWGPFQWH